MVSFNKVQWYSFIGVISRRPALQVLSCGTFDHLLQGQRELPLLGGKTLGHNAL